MTRLHVISAAGLLTVTACIAERDCITQGAVRQRGVCDCPEGTRFRQEPGSSASRCETDDAGTATGIPGADASSTAWETGEAGTTNATRPAALPDTSVNSDGATAQPIASPASDAGLEDASQVEQPVDSGATLEDASIGPSTACQPSVPTTEVCDGKDNDCDGAVDEGVLDAPAWFADCDADNFPAIAATAQRSCGAPQTISSCLGWTKQAPTPGSVDCNDYDPSYRPGADYGVKGAGDGDLNCDGVVDHEPLLRQSTTQLAGGQVSPGAFTINTCQRPTECNCAAVFNTKHDVAFDCSSSTSDWREYVQFLPLEAGKTECMFVHTGFMGWPTLQGIQYCK